MNLCVWRILTLSSYSHFAQGHIPYLFSIYILCAILELSGTIPELADRVRIPTLRRTIPELYRFLLCAEHIYMYCSLVVLALCIKSFFFHTLFCHYMFFTLLDFCISFLLYCLVNSTARGFFQFPTHPSGADLFAPCNPTQGSTQTLPVILWYSPCDPPAISLCFHPNGWNHRVYKIWILSTQVKQGKVHRILIIPLQSHSKAPLKNTCVFIAVFPPKQVESQRGKKI